MNTYTHNHIQNKKPTTVGVVFSGFVSILMLLVFGFIHTTQAAPNYEINYQGKLTNASNVSVADGTYNMRFWLLTSPSIATTSAVWTESLTTTDKVQVTNGLFSVMLGSTSPLTGVDFNQTLYLGVEIGGTSSPAWDGEMSPRKILGTVPSAFEAKNAETFSGIATTSFLRSDQADSASGLLTFTGGIISNSSSTITNLTTLIATTTTLVINGEQFTDLTGTGLTISSGALTATLGTDITAGEIANGDHGFFSYASGVASLDTGGLSSSDLASALTDETGTAGYAVFSTNPLLSGFRSSASSTIGGGTGATGLTISGGATTTGNAYFGGNVGIGSTSPSAKLTLAGGTFDLHATSTEGTTGSELITNVADRDFSSDTGNWTGTNWSIGSGVATHVAGNNAYTLSNTALSSAPSAGNYYQITFSINTTATGTPGVSVTFGGTAAVPRYGTALDGSQTNQVVVMQAVSAGALTITPNNATWTGTIDDVSIKQITPSALAQIIRNADGTAGLELRAGGTGLSNTFVGKDAGLFNTTGSYNIANGSYSLRSNTTGSNNTANGSYSLRSNTTGSYNTANGSYSLYSNTTGSYNIANGYNSLRYNTTGSDNTANGASSLYSNTTGGSNTANGASSLRYNTTGSYNTANGSYSLFFNTTGSNNTANGSYSLYRNTIGSNNTALGNDSGYNIGTSTANTIVGYQAGYGNGSTYITSSNNTLLGYQAGYTLATSTGNLFMGYQAGDSQTLGSYNILLGYNNNLASTTGSNQLNIGNLIYGTDLGIDGSSATGNIGIGTTTPYAKLTVAGSLGLTGTFYDRTASAGTNGMVLQTTGSGVTWVATSTLGISGGAGDGVSNWSYNGSRLSPTTTAGVLGIGIFASSTIGGGTGATGLTISGGATTTGNAYFGGTLGLGTTTPSATLALLGSGATNLFAFASSTGNLLTLGADGRLTFGTTTTTNIFINGGPTSTNPFESTNQRNIGIGTQSLSYLGTGVTDNIAIGYQALYGSSSVPMTGTGNVAIGSHALYSNIDGSDNTANGMYSLYSNTTGYSNTANGKYSLFLNTTGYSNTANGYSSLTANTTGSENTASGLYSLYSNTTGYSNTANGAYSLFTNTTGNSNTANGSQSLYSNTEGNFNTANGEVSLYSNTTGSENTANGYQSLNSNTEGSYNTANGNYSLLYNTTGSENTANGSQSLFFNTTGSNNTANGYFSLRDNTTGSNNTALGYYAGLNMTVGTSTTFLGAYTNASAGVDVSSSTALGVGAFLTRSNTMVLGGTGANSVDIVTGTSTPWAKLSIQNNYGSTTPLFDIATTTSSAFATSSLFRVNHDGNVGIGTTTPSARLSVLGSGTTNLFAFASSTGSNLLTLNSRGVLTFGTTTSSNIFVNGGPTLSTPTGLFTNNIVIGNEAFLYASEGSNNIALGYQSLHGETEAQMAGSDNIALGYQSLRNNTTGSNNTANGYQSLFSNTTGSYNTANGYQALYFNTIGDQNIAIGYGALLSNTNGSENIANGRDTLSSNTEGTYNVANGAQALYSNTLGSYNIANGLNSLYSNTTGSNNTANGRNALYSNTTGSYNTALGYNAGYDMTVGTSTTFLGAYTNASAGVDVSNSTAIGTGAFLRRANTMVLGGTGANSVDIVTGTSTPWAKLSIQNNYGSTTPLFDIATTTSSAFATSSLFRVNHDGKVGIGTTTPYANLTIAGSLGLTGTFYDRTASAGTSGMVLQTTGSGVTWVATSTLGLGGGAGDGVSNWSYNGSRLSPTTTAGVLGIGIFASSTIGGGTGATGLTISGGATTTGNAYFGGRLDISPTTATNRKIGMGGTQVFYLPDQTDFIGTLIVGDGGGSLNNLGGNEGRYNTFLGLSAGTANTNGYRNVFIGHEAGEANITGYDNTFVGFEAGLLNNYGQQNSFFGFSSGLLNTDGWNNAFFGYAAGGGNTTGDENVAVGPEAGFYNQTGDFNTLIGGHAGQGVSSNSYSNVTALGYHAGYGITTGSNNLLLGYNVGDALTSGSNNIALGYDIDLPSNTASNQLSIGNLIFGTGIDGTGTTISSGNIGIGTSTPSARFAVLGGATTTNLFAFASSTGSNLLSLGADGRLTFGTTTSSNIFVNGGPTSTPLTSYLSNNIAIGNEAFSHASSTSNTQYNIALGVQALYGSSTRPMTGDRNFAVGYRPLSSNTTGYDNIAMGYDSAYYNTTGAYNNALGYFSLRYNTTGSDNNAIGRQALYGSSTANPVTGSFNNAIGNNALMYNVSGSNNNAFGQTALIKNVSGTYNSAIGMQALYYNTTGYDNNAIGRNALMYNETGYANVGVGAFAGEGTSGNSYSSSTFIGYKTGLSITTSSANILLGYQAGDALTSGSNNIALGYDIDLPSNTASNQLSIGNLIFGTGIDGTGTSISSGKIGIASNTPSRLLTVAGDIYALNNITAASSTLGYASSTSLTVAEKMFVLQGTLWNNWSSTPFLVAQDVPFGGNGNTILGAEALRYIWDSGDLSDTHNTVIGAWALPELLSGSGNIALGSSALGSMATGSNNIVIGYLSGYGQIKGDGNIIVGSEVELASSTASNQLSIGNLIFGTGIDGTGTSISSGKIGIASNTPSRLLTVAGDIYALNNITAASGTIAYASTTGLTATNANITNSTSTNITATGALIIGGDVITDITGTNLSITNGILSASGGGGSSNWLFDGTRLTPSTSPVGIGIFASSTIGGGTGTTGLTISGGATTTGNAYFGGTLGIGSTSPESQTLTIDKAGLTGSVIGGIKERLQFTNSTLSAVYYGDNTYIVNAPTATSTLVGSMLRIEDSSGLGNTVRGLEVQAHRGTNTKGENTALSGYGRTFGVRGTTIGDAGDTYQPAGVFAETQGTTQGNALRAYSGSITTEDLVSLFHDGSAFTGTGLQMNFGNTTGSFTGASAKFLDLQVAGDSKFVIMSTGYTGIGSSTPSRALTVAGETYLGATTTLAAHLLPLTDDTYDLGSTSLRFRDLYLGPATLHIGTSATDEATFSYDTGSNIFNIGTDSTTNGDIAFFTDDLFIDKSTGYVGIGTTTPWGALTVGGTAQFSNITVNGTLNAATTNLGTPSSLTLTNATGLPISTGISGLGTDVATFLATPSSANLIQAVTGETGTGALVFATSPSFTTPSLGAASASSLTLSSALAVSYGGTGATTLTGIVKGNGTGAFTAISGTTVSGAAVASGCTSAGSITTSSGVITSFTGASGCDAPTGATPYIFVWDGKGYNPVSDFMFGYPKTSFTDYEEGITAYEAGEVGGDIYPLAVAPILEDDEYKIEIREIESEDTYLDQFSLYKVGHASGTTIVTDNEFKHTYALTDEELGDLISPSNITYEENTENTSSSSVLVDFPSGGSGKMLFESNLRTAGQTIIIGASYQDENGEWVHFTDIQPRRPNTTKYIVDLPSEITGPFTLKLSTFKDIEVKTMGILREFTPLPYDEEELAMTEPPHNKATGESVADLINTKDNSFTRLSIDDAITFRFADAAVDGGMSTFLVKADGFYVTRVGSNSRITSLVGKVSYLEDLVNGLETRTSFPDFLNGTTTPALEGDSLWNRLVALASNFVDGVLTLTGLKTNELCVGNVCVDEATFLQMVESAGATPIQSGATGGTGTTTEGTGGGTGTTTESTGGSSGEGTGGTGGETGGGEVPPPVEETPPPEEPPIETPPVEEPPAPEPAPEPPPEETPPTE